MRAHIVLLGGALLLGLWVAGCDDGDGPRPPVDAGVPPGPGTDGGDGGNGGGGPDAGDGGVVDAGRSDFACNVARQEGCGAGQSCLFADLADGGTGSQCFTGTCDAVRQDCPSGQRCTYVTLDGGTTQRMCVAEGTADEGAPCTLATAPPGQTYDTCKQGLFCKDERAADGGLSFFCRQLCHASTQCDAGDCNTVLRLEGTPELPLVCGAPSAACDPFGQDCAAPLSCYPSTSGPVCAGIGNLGEGATCEFSNQCAAGSTCVRTEGGLTCRKLCRLPSGDPTCASGTCRSVDNNPSNVGACVP